MDGRVILRMGRGQITDGEGSDCRWKGVILTMRRGHIKDGKGSD